MKKKAPHLSMKGYNKGGSFDRIKSFFRLFSRQLSFDSTLYEYRFYQSAVSPV